MKEPFFGEPIFFVTGRRGAVSYIIKVEFYNGLKFKIKEGQKNEEIIYNGINHFLC